MSSDENNSWWDSVAQLESIKGTCKTMKFAKPEFWKICISHV